MSRRPCPFVRPDVHELCRATCTLPRCTPTGPDEPAELLIGGLFSGYGGLEMAVREVFGGRVAWHVEYDTAPSRVLAHHWPDVPNYGDITAVDWSTVPRVNILCGGFPCQDLSGAGKRAGLRPGTRSGLWEHFAYAIHELRPELVVIENVRGLLNAPAHSDVEPCPWCMGDDCGEPAVRALGAVLADLARLGYDARWCGLPAAAVGAPHGRFRVFLLAVRRDAAADATDDGHERGRSARGRRVGPADHDRDAADADLEGPQGSEPAAGHDLSARSPRAATDPSSHGRAEGGHDTLGGDRPADSGGTGQPVGVRAGDGPVPVDWGSYDPAIRRWEAVLGRPAPSPHETGTKGQPRLSPLFVEWMMGLAAGHVTGVPGLSRADMLKLLGNGVVTQQAAAALRYLLTVSA